MQSSSDWLPPSSWEFSKPYFLFAALLLILVLSTFILLKMNNGCTYFFSVNIRLRYSLSIFLMNFMATSDWQQSALGRIFCWERWKIFTLIYIEYWVYILRVHPQWDLRRRSRMRRLSGVVYSTCWGRPSCWSWRPCPDTPWPTWAVRCSTPVRWHEGRLCYCDFWCWGWLHGWWGSIYMLYILNIYTTLAMSVILPVSEHFPLRKRTWRGVSPGWILITPEWRPMF